MFGTMTDLVTWPEHHFTVHTRGSVEFDQQSFRVLLSLRAASRKIDVALAEWALETGVSQQRFGLMVVLLAEAAPVSLSEIARFLGTTQASVTGLIGGLETDGHVRRETGIEDRRLSFLSLTESGKALVAQHLDSYFAANRRGMGGLEEGEKRTLADLLSRVVAGYEGVI